MPNAMNLSAVDLLAQLTFVVSAHLEASATSEDLSMQQVRLLGILRDREPTINELAAHLEIDKSSMSGAVVRAEKRGLVRRTPDPHDGRSVRVQLTPTGRALMSTAVASFEKEVERILAPLNNSERQQWMELTSRVLDAAPSRPEPPEPTEQGSSERE